MNKIEEISRIFNMNIDEDFNVIYGKMGKSELSPYRFTKKGLEDRSGAVRNEVLGGLITGEYQIERIPFKPNEEGYYFIGTDGMIYDAIFKEYLIRDLMNYGIGNCFENKMNAERSRIEILEKFKIMKEKLEKGE